jgi:uncharacterized membrane protein (DUF485 family)
MMQECDYVTDGFVLLICSFMWLTKPGHLRRQDYLEYMCIIFCVKFSFFLDRERSMNFEVDPQLASLRTQLASETTLLTLLPLVLMLPLELFISHKNELGLLHMLQGVGLTAALFLYQFDAAKDPFEGRDPDSVKLNKKIDAMAEHQNHLAAVGTNIYLAIFICLVFTLLTSFRSTWETTSIQVGLILLKAAMLVSGKQGGFVYFCMLL